MQPDAGRPRWPLLAALLLIAPLGLVAASSHMDENESDPAHDRGRGPDHGANRSMDLGPASAREGAAEDAAGDRRRGSGGAHAREGPRALGSFSSEGNIVTGAMLSFKVEEELPGVTEVAFDGQPVALAIALPVDDGSAHSMQGALFRYESGGARLRLLNTPNALVFVDVDEGTTALVTLASGLAPQALAPRDEHDAGSASDEEDGEDDDSGDERPVSRWNVALDNGTLSLVGRNVTVAGNVITVGDRLMMRLVGPLGEAHASPDEDHHLATGRAKAHELRDDVRARVEDAIAAGDIAVEVFADADAQPVSFELGHVRVHGANAHRTGSVRAELDIEAADGSPGAVVVLNLDAEDLGFLTADEAADVLSVTANGETLGPADDMHDVLRWDDDDAPEYLLFMGHDDAKLVLSLPYFSPFTIQVIDTQSAGESASRAPMATLLVLVVAMSAAAVAVRPKA